MLPKEGIHHCNEEIVQIQKSKNDGNILKIVNSPSEGDNERVAQNQNKSAIRSLKLSILHFDMLLNDFIH